MGHEDLPDSGDAVAPLRPSEAVEGAAFEGLTGFHGGLGGPQSRPFVLAPAELAQPSRPLVGARDIHDLFTTWLSEVQGRIHDAERKPTGQ